MYGEPGMKKHDVKRKKHHYGITPWNKRMERGVKEVHEEEEEVGEEEEEEHTGVTSPAMFVLQF